MSVTNEFLEAVEEKDTLMVRIMLKDSMVFDPTLCSFDEMASIAEKSISDLYDIHNGEVFTSDISKWNKNHMDEQMVILLDNFSKERIQHLKNVCKHIYAERADQMEKERIVDKHKQTNSSQKQVGTGITVGGVAIAVAGIVFSKPLIIGAGVIAAVAGGIMIATDK